MFGALKRLADIFLGKRKGNGVKVAASIPVYRAGMELVFFGTAAVVTFFRKLGWTYLPIFLILWIGNMLLMGGVIKANKETNLDFTSMGGMRNFLNKAYKKSKLLGCLVEVLFFFGLVIWAGADHFIIFFDKRFSSKKTKIIIFLMVSFCNMTIWTLVFIWGADGFLNLVSQLY